MRILHRCWHPSRAHVSPSGGGEGCGAVVALIAIILLIGTMSSQCDGNNKPTYSAPYYTPYQKSSVPNYLFSSSSKSNTDIQNYLFSSSESKSYDSLPDTSSSDCEESDSSIYNSASPSSNDYAESKKSTENSKTYSTAPYNQKQYTPSPSYDSDKRVFVHGYYRKNGTYVHSYYRKHRSK